jgi:hypothetical protein
MLAGVRLCGLLSRLVPSAISILLNEASHRVSPSVNGGVVSSVGLGAVAVDVVTDSAVVVGCVEDDVPGAEWLQATRAVRVRAVATAAVTRRARTDIVGLSVH